MTPESTANEAELDTGANPQELTGDSALDLLIQRENEMDPEQDAPEEEAPAEDEPEQEQDAPPEDPEIDFELDGKPIKIRKSELPQIYRNQLLDADYRQKTAAAAELTRQAEQERQRIAQERQQGVSQLDSMLSVLHQELVGDQSRLDDLLDTDPVAYMKVRREVERKEQLIQQALGHRQVLTQQEEAEQYRAHQDFLKAEQAKLQEKLPEWRDTKVRETESRAIAEHLIATGYSQDELNMLTDHRALLLVRNAMKYRQMLAVRQKQAPPTPTKTVSPGARNPNPPAENRLAELQKRAQRTGKTEDIQAYLIAKES